MGLFPILPGETAFFGLDLAGSPDWRIVSAYWTQGGRVLFPLISWPNQRWNVATGQFEDIVNGYQPPVNPQIILERDFVVVQEPIPLSGLTWDETVMLPWQNTGLAEWLPWEPGFSLDLSIPLQTTGNAVLVRYPAYSPSERLQASYTNQLDIPGGVEIRWFSIDGSCVLPGAFRHFGYGLNTIQEFFIVASYWTWNGIPILPFMEPVQQTWIWEGAPFVIDRVWGFPPLVEPQGVTIRRDFAFQPVVPLGLDQLTWEESGALPWIPADPAPQWIPPDSFFDIFLETFSRTQGPPSFFRVTAEYLPPQQ